MLNDGTQRDILSYQYLTPGETNLNTSQSDAARRKNLKQRKTKQINIGYIYIKT